AGPALAQTGRAAGCRRSPAAARHPAGAAAAGELKRPASAPLQFCAPATGRRPARALHRQPPLPRLGGPAGEAPDWRSGAPVARLDPPPLPWHGPAIPMHLDLSAPPPCAPELARLLLGARLTLRGAGGRITETEAYTQDDPASHSFAGPRPRNRAM